MKYFHHSTFLFILEIYQSDLSFVSKIVSYVYCVLLLCIIRLYSRARYRIVMSRSAHVANYILGHRHWSSRPSGPHSRVHEVASDDGYVRDSDANAPRSRARPDLVVHSADESAFRPSFGFLSFTFCSFVCVLFCFFFSRFSSRESRVFLINAQVYTNLGVNSKLKLTGRPLRPIGALGTSKVRKRFVDGSVFTEKELREGS